VSAVILIGDLLLLSPSPPNGPLSSGSFDATLVAPPPFPAGLPPLPGLLASSGTMGSIAGSGGATAGTFSVGGATNSTGGAETPPDAGAADAALIGIPSDSGACGAAALPPTAPDTGGGEAGGGAAASALAGALGAAGSTLVTGSDDGALPEDADGAEPGTPPVTEIESPLRSSPAAGVDCACNDRADTSANATAAVITIALSRLAVMRSSGFCSFTLVLRLNHCIYLLV